MSSSWTTTSAEVTSSSTSGVLHSCSIPSDPYIACPVVVSFQFDAQYSEIIESKEQLPLLIEILHTLIFNTIEIDSTRIAHVHIEPSTFSVSFQILGSTLSDDLSPLDAASKFDDIVSANGLSLTFGELTVSFLQVFHSAMISSH
jgi:hypothetical protein